MLRALEPGSGGKAQVRSRATGPGSSGLRGTKAARTRSAPAVETRSARPPAGIHCRGIAHGPTAGRPAGNAALRAAAAAEKCVRHFETCVRREDCERVIAVMQQLGPAALEYLRQQLTVESAEQAVLSVGLLSRLDRGLLERALPSRMRGWRGMYQDTAIRQLASGASPARGNLLLKLLDYAD